MNFPDMNTKDKAALLVLNPQVDYFQAPGQVLNSRQVLHAMKTIKSCQYFDVTYIIRDTRALDDVQRILAKADSDLIHDTTVSTKMERSAMAVVLFCLWIQTIFRLKGLPLIGPVSVTFFRTIFSWEVIIILLIIICFTILRIALKK